MVEESKENVIYDWRVHLAAQDKFYRPCLAAVLIFLSLSVVQMYSNIFLTIPLALVLFLAVADYFFPMRFRITDQGAYRIATTGTNFLSWKKVKNVYLDDKGVKLSLFDRPTRLEAFRGLYLYFGKEADGRDRIISAIRQVREGAEKNLNGIESEKRNG
ncbi:MAG: hypothetical protein N2234_04745 [Planctomycetota bacterium]|nr:hypothetical protein [Planctomycetota bacterium]